MPRHIVKIIFLVYLCFLKIGLTFKHYYMKKVLLGMFITLAVVALLVGGFIGYHKLFRKTVDINAFSAVPSDAAFVIETENLSKAWSTLSGSALWQYLKSTEYFAL